MMSLSLVNTCSDSENSDDHSTIESSRRLNSENVQNCENLEATAAGAGPLFKIFFRDEITSRKYRRRVEDIIKYVMSIQVDEVNNDATATNLLLEIYDPVENNGLSTTVCSSKKDKEELNKNTDSLKRKRKNSHHSHDSGNIQKKLMHVSVPEKRVDTSKNNKKTQCNQEPQDHDSALIEEIQNNNEHNERQSIRIDQNECEENHHQSNDLETCFNNTYMRIGSYEYFNRNNIIISNYCLSFFVPTLESSNHSCEKLKILSLRWEDISEVLVDITEISFVINPKAGQVIRKVMNMNNPNGPYFDPESLDPKHHYIHILLMGMSDERKRIIRELFKNKISNINPLSKDKIALACNTNNINNKVNKDTTVSEELQISSELHGNDTTNNNLTLKNLEISYSSITTDNSVEIFLCKIVRIGSYEYVKKRVFSISENEVKFCVPSIDTSKTSITKIALNMGDIIEFGIKFSKLLPVIFLYITTEAARYIRNILGMTSSTEPYIDPTGDDVHNKIIIFPVKISENSHVLQNLLNLGKIKKLDEENASDILAKSLSNIPRVQNSQLNENSVSNVQTTEEIQLYKNCVDVQLGLGFVHLNLGSFKCNDFQDTFTISNQYLKFHVVPKDMNIGLDFTVGFNEMTKILFYLSKKRRVLCFYTTESCAKRVRSLLRMYDSNNDPYFHPFSENLSQQGIYIILKGNKYKMRVVKSILEQFPSRKLSNKEIKSIMKICG